MSMPTVRQLLVFHFECLQGMYFSEYRTMEGGSLLGSAVIADPYYNFFAPEGAVESVLPSRRIAAELERRGRQPAVYLTPLTRCAHDSSVPESAVWARDAWLVGETGSLAVDPGGSVRTMLVDGSQRAPYVNTFAAAYSGDDPDDPYGQLDPAYTQSLDASFDVEVPDYRKYYLLATVDDQPVGVAAMFTAGQLAGVYGVGTVPTARRVGVGTAIMAHLARIALADGVSHIMLQTEAGSPVQRWYERMGYRHVFTAPYLAVTRDPDS